MNETAALAYPSWRACPAPHLTLCPKLVSPGLLRRRRPLLPAAAPAGRKIDRVRETPATQAGVFRFRARPAVFHRYRRSLMPLRMRLYDREHIGAALRRFKKLMERSGLLKAL